MTTFEKVRTNCAVCGRRVKYYGLGSSTAFGHPDLDFRPPERTRSLIGALLHQCPKCGYCAENLGEANPTVAAMVLGEAYQTVRNEMRHIGPLALMFHLAAYVATELGEHREAFHLTLHEAWVFDDSHDPGRASATRLRAHGLMNQAHQKSETVFEREGADAAVAVDLLRRTGDFSGAEKLCRQAMAEDCEDSIRQVLEYQLELCSRRDTDAHTTEKAFK